MPRAVAHRAHARPMAPCRTHLSIPRFHGERANASSRRRLARRGSVAVRLGALHGGSAPFRSARKSFFLEINVLSGGALAPAPNTRPVVRAVGGADGAQAEARDARGKRQRWERKGSGGVPPSLFSSMPLSFSRHLVALSLAIRFLRFTPDFAGARFVARVVVSCRSRWTP